jgi:hypothetical protein
MNQEQVMQKLLQLDDTVEDFIVTLSGKSSSKVDGLYKPESREIIIHNKNHGGENSLMYTAIHEFAHHIQFTTSAAPVSARSHTNHFYSILHKLLGKAQELGIYVNVFDSEKEFLELTKIIKENFLHINGQLMKDLGAVLIQAHELCRKHEASFEDYVDRVLGLHHSAAKSIVKVHSMNISPEIGYENMKTVASVKDDGIRELVQEAFLEGQSPDMVKARFTARPRPADKVDFLMKEKDRLEKSLEAITVKLAKVERELEALKYE